MESPLLSEEAIVLAHKVSAFQGDSVPMATPPPYRTPIDVMDIDVMSMHALTGRRPKDRRELYDEHARSTDTHAPPPQGDRQPQPYLGVRQPPPHQGNRPASPYPRPPPPGNGYRAGYNTPLHPQLQPMTNDEREYLMANNWCFRCRQLGHWYQECPTQPQQ